MLQIFSYFLITRDNAVLLHVAGRISLHKICWYRAMYVSIKKAGEIIKNKS